MFELKHYNIGKNAFVSWLQYMNIKYNCQQCGGYCISPDFFKKLYKKFGFIKTSHNVIEKGFSILR